jgi:FAD/FMN-containing dehydrogenase
MKAITVDPVARTVRAEPGVTWHELNDATAELGLATTGGVISTTGIAGLTLGGGLGWLMGKHGVAADNLISVEVVTARGDVLTASAQEQPDLFWALRGGGGNFGIATLFEYRLHPLRQVFGGLVAHSLADGAGALRFYREYIGAAPDELAVMGLLVHTPDGAPVTAFAICHAGDPALAEVDLKPFLEFGSPVMANVGPMPYPAVNSMLDESFPAGVLNYWKSSFLRDLSDEAIDALLERFSSVPSPMTGIAIEHMHGAVTRVGVSDTAMPHREPGFNVLIASEWTDPEATEANIAWTRESYASLEPFFSARRYVNYLDQDDGNAVRSAYGPNYERLAELKRIYDPDNLFHLNLNIVPATLS